MLVVFRSPSFSRSMWVSFVATASQARSSTVPAAKMRRWIEWAPPAGKWGQGANLDKNTSRRR